MYFHQTSSLLRIGHSECNRAPITPGSEETIQKKYRHGFVPFLEVILMCTINIDGITHVNDYHCERQGCRIRSCMTCAHRKSITKSKIAASLLLTRVLHFQD